MLIQLQIHSQTTLKETNKIKAIVNKKGDTLIIIPVKDVRIILTNLKVCELERKELAELYDLNLLKDSLITNQKNIIVTYKLIVKNFSPIEKKYKDIIFNKEEEILELNEELNRQILYKNISIFTGLIAVTLSIIFL